MPIQKTQDIMKFDDQNLPVMKNVLDQLAQEATTIKHVETAPTADDVKDGEFVVDSANDTVSVRKNDGDILTLQNFTPSTSNALSGSIVDIEYTLTGAVATGTGTVPDDDSKMENDEGDEWMTLAITPKATTNLLFILAVAHQAHNAGGHHIVGLFQDSTVEALRSVHIDLNDAGIAKAVVLFHVMQAGTTSATTFKIRGGNASAGTTTFNGEGAARIQGGALCSGMLILEFKA